MNQGCKLNKTQIKIYLCTITFLEAPLSIYSINTYEIKKAQHSHVRKS